LQGKDKTLSLGDKSLATIINHLNTHPNESAEYNKATAESDKKKWNHLNTRSNKIIPFSDKQHLSRHFKCICKMDCG